MGFSDRQRLGNRAAHALPQHLARAVTLEPTYTWSTIDEAKVTQLLAPFVWTYGGFEIAPRSDKTIGADCALPVATHFVSLMPQMHKLGTHFGASVIGGPQDG